MNELLPKISILIPCYNQAYIIDEVIKAAFQQTSTADEIIVVDDGSSDDSANTIEKFPVQLIRHEHNKGLSETRNTALSAANGDIVLFIDGDAIADAQLVESIQAAYLETNLPSLAGVGGRATECINKNIYDKWRSLHARQDFGASARLGVPFLHGLCMSFKKQVLLQMGGFDPFYVNACGEDFDLGIRLRRAGFCLYYTPEAIVYHQHADNEALLKRNQYNWYYWGYQALKRNKMNTWRIRAAPIKRLFLEIVHDLFFLHDTNLMALDLEIFKVRMLAIRHASKAFI